MSGSQQVHSTSQCIPGQVRGHSKFTQPADVYQVKLEVTVSSLNQSTTRQRILKLLDITRLKKYRVIRSWFYFHILKEIQKDQTN